MNERELSEIVMHELTLLSGRTPDRELLPLIIMYHIAIDQYGLKPLEAVEKIKGLYPTQLDYNVLMREIL